MIILYIKIKSLEIFYIFINVFISQLHYVNLYNFLIVNKKKSKNLSLTLN